MHIYIYIYIYTRPSDVSLLKLLVSGGDHDYGSVGRRLVLGWATAWEDCRRCDPGSVRRVWT